MALCAREAVRQKMLRRAAARLWEERASRMTVRDKRHARLLTNLVSLRIPEESAAAQVRDMHLWPAAQHRDACSCLVIIWGYWTGIDIGSGKCRGLVRVRRGMRWPAGLPSMPLEVMSILHLLTCITTRTGRCCFTLFYSCFTRALLLYIIELLYLYWFRTSVVHADTLDLSIISHILYNTCIICLWSMYREKDRWNLCFAPALCFHTHK